MPDLLGFEGNDLIIAHEVTPGEGHSGAFTVSNVLCDIRPVDNLGFPTIDNGAGAATSTGTAENPKYIAQYVWDLTGDVAGRYVYTLYADVGSGQQPVGHGFITVWSQTSLYYKWIDRMFAYAGEHRTGELQQRNATLDHVRAIELAVLEYSRSYPRKRTVDITLTANDWTYPLSGLTGWVNDFSRIVSIIPAYNATYQAQTYLQAWQWAVDELAATPEWRFVETYPATGDTARIVYTVPHTVSHTEDTVPSQWQPRVAQYAAGEVLELEAGKMLATSAPHQGAQFLDYGEKALMLRDQASRLKDAARKAWRRPEVAL